MTYMIKSQNVKSFVVYNDLGGETSILFIATYYTPLFSNSKHLTIKQRDSLSRRIVVLQKTVLLEGTFKK